MNFPGTNHNLHCLIFLLQKAFNIMDSNLRKDYANDYSCGKHMNMLQCMLLAIVQNFIFIFSGQKVLLIHKFTNT